MTKTTFFVFFFFSEYEISTLYQEAHSRWLKPPEVLFILQNHESLTLTNTAPQRPTSMFGWLAFWL